MTKKAMAEEFQKAADYIGCDYMSENEVVAMTSNSVPLLLNSGIIEVFQPEVSGRFGGQWFKLTPRALALTDGCVESCCPNCGGRGLFNDPCGSARNSRVTCQHCNGIGWVAVKEVRR
jgi:hypothetical protein